MLSEGFLSADQFTRLMRACLRTLPEAPRWLPPQDRNPEKSGCEQTLISEAAQEAAEKALTPHANRIASGPQAMEACDYTASLKSLTALREPLEPSLKSWSMRKPWTAPDRLGLLTPCTLR